MGLHNFSIPAPSGVLHGVVHMPETEPRALAVVAHPLPTAGGNMEHKIVTTLAKTLNELGMTTLRFNFRGVGESTGSYDAGNGEVDDALAIVRYGQQEFGDLPLVLAGFSFGGYVQACVAERLHPHPHSLILIAPAVSHFAMPQVPPHTLVVHGEDDQVVPFADAMAWARPQQLPIVTLQDTGHYFHGRLHQLKDIVRGHFTGHAL